MACSRVTPILNAASLVNADQVRVKQTTQMHTAHSTHCFILYIGHSMEQETRRRMIMAPYVTSHVTERSLLTLPPPTIAQEVWTYAEQRANQEQQVHVILTTILGITFCYYHPHFTDHTTYQEEEYSEDK